MLLSPRSLLGVVWHNRTVIVKVKVTESPLGEQSNVLKLYGVSLSWEIKAFMYKQETLEQ